MATSEARTALDNTGCSVADIYFAIVELSFAQLGSLLSRSWDIPARPRPGQALFCFLHHAHAIADA